MATKPEDLLKIGMVGSQMNRPGYDPTSGAFLGSNDDLVKSGSYYYDTDGALVANNSGAGQHQAGEYKVNPWTGKMAPAGAATTGGKATTSPTWGGSGIVGKAATSKPATTRPASTQPAIGSSTSSGQYGNLITDAGPAAFQAGGNSYSVARKNSDGTISWARSDGIKFDNMDRATFVKYFGEDAANQYYGAADSIYGGSTAERVNFLLSENSPFLQSAQKRAMTTANSRGLINSSIAAGMGTKAAIDAAYPIASTDAGIASSEFISGQQLSSAERQAAAQRAFEGGENALQRAWQTGENVRAQDWQAAQNDISRQFEATWNQKKMDFEAQQAQLGRTSQADLQYSAQAWQAGQNEANRAWEAEQNQLNREAQAGLQNSTEGRTAVANLIGNYGAQVAAILADPNMDQASKQSQVDALYKTFQTNVVALGKVYSVNVDDLFPPPPASAPPARDDGGTPSTSTGPEGTKTNGNVVSGEN